MANIFSEHAEGGTDGATPTTGNTTFGVVTSPTGLTFAAAQHRDGLLSFHVNAVANVPQPTAIFGAAKVVAYNRYYVYPLSNPSASTYIMSARNNANTIKAADLRINTDGTVAARDSIATTIVSTGTSLALNAWNRIEWAVSPATSGSYQYLRLFVGSNVDGSTPDFQSLAGTCSTSGATDIGRFVYGLTASTTYEYYFDTIDVDDTAWVGPLTPVSNFFFNHFVQVG